LSVISFDSETWLIEPGCMAPPLVCVQWSVDGGSPQILHRDRARATVEGWLRGSDTLVGHNVAYDMGVIAAQWPDLLPLIFAKYDRDEITDTMLREQLLRIAVGTFRREQVGDEWLPVKYSLADCIRRHFGRNLKKEGWRLFYRCFDQVPNVEEWPEYAMHFMADGRAARWPEWAIAIPTDEDRAGLLASTVSEATEYALADATNTYQLKDAQDSAGTFYADLYSDQFRQARAAFALHLSSCWGLYTDADAVEKLAVVLEAEFAGLTFELQQLGIVKPDGSATIAVAREWMIRACEEAGVPTMATKKGAVSLSAEACARFDPEEDGDLDNLSDAADAVCKYSRFQRVRKTLSNDIEMLRAGCDVPIQPRYGLAETGRTRATKPNIQAINRGHGIREAFRPRQGTVFAQADFEGLELHTLAAWCLEVIGWSHLADTLNAGQDVHLAMAADLMGVTYDDALARHKAHDPEMKEWRQRAKALNFGLPGGLGAEKFALYAKASYGVHITIEEARQYKARWLQRFPEMNEFFRLASMATNNPDKLGTEIHLFTKRLRGGSRYSALCNGRFQGLGADAAKEALWRVTRACYVEPGSALYGSRVVAFVHDELIIESAEAVAPEAAVELGRVMMAGANVYLGRVPVRLTPQLMSVWSKKAEPVYGTDGRLIPWTAPVIEE